jgi:GNAT superfamily N-acetyltransferase
MNIKKIAHNKKQYLDLLLLADESEEMIDKYFEKGDLYAIFDEDLKRVCVVIELDEQSCELKNIATCEKYQGKGYGRTMINYVIEVYKEQYKTMYLGTGEVPSILSFYNSCGFKESHRIKNFFTDNYDHIMIEEGIQLVDMVYLKKEL